MMDIHISEPKIVVARINCMSLQVFKPLEVVVAHVLSDVLLRSQLLSLDQAQMASKPNF